MRWDVLGMEWGGMVVERAGLGLGWVQLEWGWCELRCGRVRVGRMLGEFALVCCACRSSPCVAHPPHRSMYSVIFACRVAIALATSASSASRFFSLRDGDWIGLGWDGMDWEWDGMG